MLGGLLAGVLLAAPARADVTVTSTITGTGRMTAGSGSTTIRLKGGKMRNDMTNAKGEMTTIIMDLDAGKMISIDHKKKEAIVMDGAMASEVTSKVKDTDVVVKLTPTSVTKQVAGQTCTVHDSEVKINFSPAEGMTIGINMTGPVCLSKTAPGQADYAKFYTAAVEKGFFFGDPQAAKGNPGIAKGFQKLYKAFADAGMPLSQTTTIKFEGGMMAGMMNKMAGGDTTSEVTNIDTSSIPDDQFAPPAGYKVKTQ
jgi:hypothetical protein